MTSESTPIALAPWNLKGRGFMFIYHFDKGCGSLAHFMPKEHHGAYQGGLGALMLVDYESSNAGPYQEILFIPGKFSLGGQRRHAISRIWVSSQESVVSGRANWGIPKDLASFAISQQSKGHETWAVSEPGKKPFFAAEVSFGGVPFPVHTAALPMPLLQTWRGNRFLTRFRGFGLGRFAHLDRVTVDTEIFPDLAQKKPLFGIEVSPFRLTFPKAEISKFPG
jgi:hypothetical protein